MYSSYEVPCPTCKVKVNEKCRELYTGTRDNFVHVKRAVLALYVHRILDDYKDREGGSYGYRKIKEKQKAVKSEPEESS